MKPIRYYVLGGLAAGFFTCLPIHSYAQVGGVPRQMSYQGVLREGDKVPADGMYSVVISLYDKATGGQPLWQETQTVEVKGGLFNIILGQYVPLSAPLPADTWIGVSFNSMGEMPRTKLTTVPYTFNAVTAQSLMPNATGAVLSLNGQQGALELRATDGFEVRTDKGVLTIGKTQQSKEDEVLNQGTEWLLAGNGNATANSWLGTSNNIPLVVRTSNTERMRILSSNGNVGIGETNPSSRLSVARTLHITNTGGTPELKLSAPSGANSTTFKTTGQSANITYTLPPDDGDANEVLTTNGSGVLTWAASGWGTTGNAASSTNFLGTTNAQPLIVKTNNVERYRVTSGGAMGINEDNPTQKLEVAGNILVKVDGTGTGELRLQEPSGNMGNNYTGFKAGNLPVNVIYTLPTTSPLEGQVLSSNTQGILSWITPSTGATGTAGGDLTGTYPSPTIANDAVDGTKIALGSDANGDMMYYNGTDYVRLPIGSSGEILTVSSGIPTWSVGGATGTASGDLTGTYPNPTIANNAVDGTKIALGSDANGDIMYYNGTDYVRLPIGSSGQQLIVSSGIPAWSAPTILSLPTTTVNGTAGVIRQNSQVIYHSYGNNATFFGEGAGNAALATSTTNNVGIGYYSLNSNVGNQNTAVGVSAMSGNSSGGGNTAIGFSALSFGSSGNLNSAFGQYALVSVNGGNQNVGLGYQAGNYVTTGSDNVYVGANSGSGGVQTTGSNNTFLGASTGQRGGANTSFSSVTLIGYNSNMGADNLTNATAIGANAVVSTNNSLVLGNTNVNVGIGTSTPGQKLDVANGNIILSNSSGSVGSLRFQEQAVNGANYVGFRAPNSIASDVTWTLPDADGSSGQVLTTNGSGTLSWANDGVINFTSNRNMTAPNATVPVHQLIASGTEVNIDIALTPKGTGALTAHSADGTATGGNKRGTYAVDWQMSRLNATEVASGDYAIIGGGEYNTASGNHAIVNGGQSNVASNFAATISGGQNNAASGSAATISGGQNNIASNTGSVIGGGQNNTASNFTSTVAGGLSNTASGQMSAIGGGQQNTASGDNSTINGGSQNTVSGTNSSIVGGRGLTLSGDGSVGFVGNNSGGTRNMSVSTANTAVLGNIDLWLANNDNTPRSLRFYEQYNTAGAYPNGSNYVGFRAPNSIASDVTWTLPDADGTSGQVLTTNGSGTLNWVTPSVSGAAGGDLTGTYPNPIIANDAVTTAKISSSGASSGNVITYNGTDVVWAAPSTATTVTNSTLAGDGSAGNLLRINLGNSNTWTANQTFASTFLIASNTRIALTNSDNNGRDIRWQEPSGTGTQYIGWRAPNVSNNGNYVFPATVGSVGQVLGITTSNGIDSARTSWVTPSVSGAAGGDLTGTYPNPTIANDAVTTAKIANNQINGTKIALGSDANGDIMYYNGTDYTRRAIGTDGQVLTVSGGVPTWADPSGGGSSVAVYSSLAIDAVNNITITNTTARFHRFAFSGTTGTSTDLNITLPDPSSYPEGTSIHFICHFETTGGSSPEFILTTPSGSIYAATSGKGQTNFSIGTLLLVTFMCDGVNYYRAP